MIRENQVIRAGVYCLLLSLNMSPRVEVENQIFESLNDIKYRADYLSNSKKNKEIDEFKRKIADLISKFEELSKRDFHTRMQSCVAMEKQIPTLKKELEELQTGWGTMARGMWDRLPGLPFNLTDSAFDDRDYPDENVREYRGDNSHRR